MTLGMQTPPQIINNVVISLPQPHCLFHNNYPPIKVFLEKPEGEQRKMPSPHASPASLKRRRCIAVIPLALAGAATGRSKSALALPVFCYPSRLGTAIALRVPLATAMTTIILTISHFNHLLSLLVLQALQA